MTKKTLESSSGTPNEEKKLGEDANTGEKLDIKFAELHDALRDLIKELISPINALIIRDKYLLIDYGAYEGCKFQDPEYATVNEAVKEAIKSNYGSPFFIVKVIDWEACAQSLKPAK